MTENTAFQIQERIELTFQSRDVNLRGRSMRFWNETLSESVGRIASSAKAEGVTSLVTPEASLFLFDRRVIMLGASPRWLPGALSLIENTRSHTLSGLLYQLQDVSEPSPREFRRRLTQIRKLADDHLGAAVVVDGTALLHARTLKPKMDSTRICLQCSMKKLGLRVENMLHRPSFAQRQAGINALSIKEVFRGYTLTEHHSLDRYCLNGVKGKEYFTLQISLLDPASTAFFEYSGPSGRELPNMIQRLLLAFAPKQYKVTALHGAQAELPEIAGFRWQSQPLGLTESIALLQLQKQGRERAKVAAHA